MIVGAGLAGGKAAETLRAEGFDGRVVLLGAEPDRPYERPPLSKDYLRGEAERDAAYVHPEAFYGEQDIELRKEVTVEALDLPASQVVLGDERLDYARLLLATGAEPRRLPVPGADLDGVHYLRDFGDSDALRARIQASGRVAVVGAGWIGAEVAASARQMGLEVTLIEQLDVPLERVLGREVGAVYAGIHRDHGVELLTGTGVEAIEGSGRAERVRLAGGRTVDCDFVVVGIGVAPRTGLAEQAGLEVGDGVHVDARLKTAHDAVFAAGDVAGAWHPFFERRLRVEHWHNALEQGPVRGPQHARHRRALRPHPVLLLRPVRGRDGVRRPRRGLGRGRLPRRRRRPRVHRLLAQGRPRARRDERERLGRHRPHPGAHPEPRGGRPRPPARPGHGSRVAGVSRAVGGAGEPVSRRRRRAAPGAA